MPVICRIRVRLELPHGGTLQELRCTIAPPASNHRRPGRTAASPRPRAWSRHHRLEARRTARHRSGMRVLLLWPPVTLRQGHSLPRHREVTLARKACSAQLFKELPPRGGRSKPAIDLSLCKHPTRSALPTQQPPSPTSRAGHRPQSLFQLRFHRTPAPTPQMPQPGCPRRSPQPSPSEGKCGHFSPFAPQPCPALPVPPSPCRS